MPTTLELVRSLVVSLTAGSPAVASVEVFPFAWQKVKREDSRQLHVVLVTNQKGTTEPMWTALVTQVSERVSARIPNVYCFVSVAAPNLCKNYGILTEAAYSTREALGADLPLFDFSIDWPDPSGNGQEIRVTCGRREELPPPEQQAKLTKLFVDHAVRLGYNPKLAERVYLRFYSAEEQEENSLVISPNWNGWNP